MLTTFYPPYHFGGDAISVQRLARGLVRRGHQVTVIHDVDAFHFLHRGTEPSPETEPEGLTVHALKSGWGRLSPLLTQQMGRPVLNGRRIRRILEEGHFDVIHFHNISLVGGPGILAAGCGVKLYMAHEHWLVCPMHVLWRHNREPCTERQCLSCCLHFGRPPQYWRYTGYLERQLRHIDTFIAVSHFSREKHRELGFPRDMEVLPNFLPDPEPQDAILESASPHDRPYFLFVGRLERIKGLADVIPLFESYRQADLLIAGDGQEAENLKGLASRAPGVRFLGRLAPDDLRRYYRHVLALIVPSLGYETFGMTLIEAFSQSAPVIARRIGPFPEIVQQAQAGELFDSCEDLLAAMRRLQSDSALRSRLGQAGYEAYRRYWSETAVIPRYLDIVERAAARRVGTTGSAVRRKVTEPQEALSADPMKESAYPIKPLFPLSQEGQPGDGN
jgi:glycosyltransferase involved in cell wall biosynthesis